jgi:hypothetical protein
MGPPALGAGVTVPFTPAFCATRVVDVPDRDGAAARRTGRITLAEREIGGR